MDHNDGPTTAEDTRRCLGGRYVLLDHLGAGGGAVVVRAQDQRLPRLVAVKLLRLKTENMRERFIREGEVLANIDHPGIVRVLDRGSDGDDPYMVLELIDGPDLAEYIHAKPLPWRTVVEIGVQLASALDAVHRQGLVHRDVKPSNVILAELGERVRVKLIDFGIARITENYRAPNGCAPWRPTAAGQALGTPGYAPLESGLVPANPLFDVFGLGATIYELLTGQMRGLPLLRLREACPDCDAPDDLDHVLAAALALEPQDRTQSVAELGRALEAVRVAHPDTGKPSERIDGRYELIGLAGTGGKGEAFVATHRGTGHDVVIKYLRSNSPDDELRFAREAKLLRTFNHPSLPRFYDYAPLAKPPFIVMEHVQGQPAARLCSPPRLKPREVAEVGLKLAQVLAVMHRRGVLHRDVNANNVLIDVTGAVALIDLGCAELTPKYYDVPAGERRYITPPEARVVIPDGGIGQLKWSAPEVNGDQGWSDKSDVYSMGHLLFRLLTGKLPEKGADPPTSPQFHSRTCPDDLAETIRAALYVDPSERPSAEQFASMLKDALETEEEAEVRIGDRQARRGALHLVPSPPADWTDHPLPDGSSEPDAPIFVEARPPVTPVAKPRGWRGVPLAALVGVVTLGAAWASMVRPQQPARPAEIRDTSRLASLAPEVKPPSPALADSGSLIAAPALPPVHAALEKATAALNECSVLAGGLMIVQFKTAEGGTSFDSVAVSGSTTPELDRCVRVATADIRFQGQGSDDFTKEYTP